MRTLTVLDTQQVAVQTPRLTERRAHTRWHCTSLAFLYPERVNGGGVLNICEAGMALSAASLLFEDQFIGLRIQGPAANQSLELTGKIAWKSESRKEAGLQFVGLTAEARERLRNWIASRINSNELFPAQTAKDPPPETSVAANPARTAADATAAQSDRGAGSRERMRNWIFSESRGETVARAIAPQPTSGQAAPQPISTWIFSEEAAGEPLFCAAAEVETRPALCAGQIDNEKRSDAALVDPDIPGQQQIQSAGCLTKSATSANPLNAPLVEQGAAHAPEIPKAHFRAGPMRRVHDRRSHIRTRIIPLGYMQLGDANGGIALNISEGGVAITAAQMLGFDQLAGLRIQFPDWPGWIETNGQVAWRSESKKEAGIRFVGLTEEARRQITDWISQQAPPAVQEPVAEILEEQFGRAPIPSRRETIELKREAHDTTAFPAQDRATCIAVSETPASLRKGRIKKPLRPRSALTRVLQATAAHRSTRIALATLLVFSGLLFVAREELLPGGDHGDAAAATYAAAAQKPKSLGEPVRGAPIARASTTANAADSTVVNADPPIGTAEPHLAEAPAVQANLMLNSERQSRLRTGSIVTIARETPNRSAAAAGRLDPRWAKKRRWAIASDASIRPFDKTHVHPASAASLAPPQLDSQTVQPANLVSPYARMAQPAKPSHYGSSVAIAPQPLIPENVVATVAVLADPYLSLRPSAEGRSKKRTQETSLQLGHLISRVAPIYPSDAKRQGIQGTVKLHVVFDRSGSVERLVLINGSSALAPAAIDAVRQWRYSKTLLAGQSVETEEDIAVVFRLLNPTAPQR